LFIKCDAKAMAAMLAIANITADGINTIISDFTRDGNKFSDAWQGIIALLFLL
jgi:hypothetical protein